MVFALHRFAFSTLGTRRLALWATVCLVSTVFAAAGCTNGTLQLTQEQMDKLDVALQRVVQGEDPSPLSVQRTTRSDGETAYGVMVRTRDADALRESGLPLGSVSGTIVSARWTVNEIRTAASLPEVQSIRASGTMQSDG